MNGTAADPGAVATAAQMAAAVRDGRVSATALVEHALARIARLDGITHAFSAVLAERALAEAARVDADRAAGRPLPPLAGVPFGAKNLFDVQGLTTLAGSTILASRPPARRDATLVERMQAQGAILVGTQHMDEFAYGFSTENSHYGPTRNPHDPTRSAGGSSGGSAAAVAAGLVPISLASDTNGSIRVPASLCGLFGLKPTFGRLSRAGSYPFVASLDHLGPLARSTQDLALAYDALRGADPADPQCATHVDAPALTPLLGLAADGLRIGVADGYFDRYASDTARAAVARAAEALGATTRVRLPQAARARAAAFVISNVEGAALHLDDLRHRFADMEPLSRERFMAGALLPAAWYVRAQRFRRWFHDAVVKLFEQVDVIIAPATPRSALPLGTTEFTLNGETQLARPAMGLLTQPISFIGLPVTVAPLPGLGDPGADGPLPIGVQLIAAPWREDHCLRVARALEIAGVAAAPVPAAFR